MLAHVYWNSLMAHYMYVKFQCLDSRVVLMIFPKPFYRFIYRHGDWPKKMNAWIQFFADQKLCKSDWVRDFHKELILSLLSLICCNLLTPNVLEWAKLSLHTHTQYVSFFLPNVSIRLIKMRWFSEGSSGPRKISIYWTRSWSRKYSYFAP